VVFVAGFIMYMHFKTYANVMMSTMVFENVLTSIVLSAILLMFYVWEIVSELQLTCTGTHFDDLTEVYVDHIGKIIHLCLDFAAMISQQVLIKHPIIHFTIILHV
jgi:hypothetical protein